MKKILLILLAFILSATFCCAQTGNNQVGVGVETNLLLSNGYSDIYHPGIGGNLKGLYGIGDASQLTLTAGYNSFGGKSSSQFGDQTLSLIPVQAGYRYNLKSGLYGEGQAGVGILTTKVTGFSFSQTNFAAAIGVGYTINGFDASIRYYTEFDVISTFAVRIAYNFSLGGKK
ncbi:MAG TPA: outer membrane beta-barrel protein [Mucilaginibacter sp.]|nr:outer membrane beta-barrel protein [Mucilaginibacter sp.]